MRPDGTRESLGSYRTKAEAERALVLEKAKQVEGKWQPTPANPGTVREWAERWLKEAHHLKPTTKVGHEQMLRRHVLPRWGDVPVNQVRREDVVRWGRWCRLGTSLISCALL